MEKMKAVDRLQILINAGGDQKDNLAKLDVAFRDRREAASCLRQAFSCGNIFAPTDASSAVA
ncbi:hypothetical protein [Bradyrhizobium iriomotense]|nr:hypothetical protein [Bradyrhizobium iriomotense]